MSRKGFRPELTGSSLQQWFRLFTAAAQCDFSKPLYKSCSFCTRSIFAQTTGLEHAHVFRHCKAAIYFSLLGSSLQNIFSLLQSAAPTALSLRWLECSRALLWPNGSCFSFRDISISQHCIAWCCAVHRVYQGCKKYYLLYPFSSLSWEGMRKKRWAILMLRLSCI